MKKVLVKTGIYSFIISFIVMLGVMDGDFLFRFLFHD